MSKFKLKNMNQMIGRFNLNFSVLSRIGICLAVSAMVMVSLGCSDSETAALDGTAAVASTDGSYLTGTTNTQSPTSTIETESNEKSVQQENDGAQESEESEEGGVLKKAGDLFGKAASSSGAAKDWVQDKLGGAAGASGQAADDSMKWANDTFQSLKDKGLTTASDTSEWLSQDWKNSQCWQYKIVTLAGENDVMTEELNKLGKDGWDCFHTEGGRFFFKKPTESYLRELPFKDFIKLVPLLHKATQ